MAPGLLLVITGPSGAGKSSIIRAVLDAEPALSFSISHTTRAPRAHERDGVEYHFIDRIEFERIRDAGGFLEWAKVHGHLYGTSLAQLENARQSGRQLLLDIDVQGAAQVAERLPGSPSVFLLPPNHASLEARLRGRRTEEESEVQRRLDNASSEVRRWEAFDYVVVNDDVARTVQEIRSILAAERLRTERSHEVVERILATFPPSAGEASQASAPANDPSRKPS